MDLLMVYLISGVGTVIWLLSPELTVVAYAGKPDAFSPWLIGLVAALGQCTSYLLFMSGGKVVARWNWVQRLVSRTQETFGERLETGFLTLTLSAASIGIPPVIALVLLCKSFGVSPRKVILLAFGGRFIRFAALAVLGDAIDLPFW